MMGAFGKFLEISIPAPDILRSLAFYRALGFVELTTGDIRPWHYAVLTDGCLAIGLHAAGIEETALTFVRPQLAKQVAALEQAGHQFEFSKLGTDEFNEAALRTPDGLMLLMMEARTWSPGDAGDEGACLVGHCTEISLGCADVPTTRAFFETAGFLAPDDGAAERSASMPVRLQAPGLTLGLRERPAPLVSLRCATRDLAAALRTLAERDLAVTRIGGECVLKAPEGTRLILC